MEHITQRPEQKSCLLASLCMVEGLGREEYESLNIRYESLMRQYGFARAWSMMAGILPWVKQGALRHSARAFCPTSGNIHNPPNLNGKGILSIVYVSRDNTPLWGHAVAYHDGMIYDPNCATPLSFAEWARTRTNTFRITDISPRPE